MTNEQLQEHYASKGRKEGRHPNWESVVRTRAELQGFDFEFYRDFYHDLRHLPPSDLIAHFLEHGKREGRFASPEELAMAEKQIKSFDADFYRAYYSDVAAFSDEQAKNHYLAFGLRDKRYPNVDAYINDLNLDHCPLPNDFSSETYLKLNSDLQNHLKKPWEPALHYMMYGRWEGRQYQGNKPSTTYNARTLHQQLSSVYDMPEVVIDPLRKPTVNVLVPAFDFASMSAGFFGVFQVALFIKRCGLNVRLVMYDKFNFDIDYSREKLKNYPGMEALFDDVEVAYIGDRITPLAISPLDNCVATVWYSAYLAKKIMALCGGRKFLYLIQDYESVFHPSGSQYALSDLSYSFNYSALFSSESLRNYFTENKIGAFGRENVDSTYFNNACASALPPKEEFISSRRQGKKKRLAFYSRPPVHRNMFELGALALILAVQEGVFPKDEWEFVGIGLGEATIELSEGLHMKQMERMNLREYQNVISTFDIGFCLMASSHPSLLPFDLAGSGAVVVTNSFGVKDQTYFDRLTRDVIVATPDVHALVEALRVAVNRANDLETRYQNALAMTFPRTWDETFTEEHVMFIRNTFKETLQ